MMRSTCILVAAALMMAGMSPAWAQDAPDDAAQDVPAAAAGDTAGPAAPADTPPWAVGVSEEARQRANALHARALKAAKDLFYADALRLYREALGHWDHPKIRYNTAFMLIKLGQPIEARDNLLKALVYGEAPLGPETYQNARNYLDLLNKQLAEVVIRCDEADVEVTLDGERILQGRGDTTRIVAPGEHQLVAKRPGMPAMVHRISLWAEQQHRIQVHPSLAMHRRWAPWKPWATAGAGAALLAAGGLLQWRAQANYDAFDRAVLDECMGGCFEDELSGATLGLERRAIWENRLAGGSFVIGGVLAATGAALIYLNQPRLEDERAFGVSIVPMAAPSAAGVSAGGTF